MGIDDFCKRRMKAVNSIALAGALALGIGAERTVNRISNNSSGAGLEACAEACTEPARTPRKRAVVVLQDYIAMDDAHLMLDILDKRGYRAEYLSVKDATEGKIFGALEKIAADSADDDKTVFYFAGHGNNYNGILQGICVNDKTSEGEEIIRPAFLLDKLAKIKGKKAICFNSCYSGVHTEMIDYDKNEEPILDNLKNYVIIAACPNDKMMVYSKDYVPGKNVGNLTGALYNLLSKGGEVNLSKAPIVSGTESQIDRVREYVKSFGVKSDEISFEIQRRSDCDFILE